MISKVYQFPLQSERDAVVIAPLLRSLLALELDTIEPPTACVAKWSALIVSHHSSSLTVDFLQANAAVLVVSGRADGAPPIRVIASNRVEAHQRNTVTLQLSDGQTQSVALARGALLHVADTERVSAVQCAGDDACLSVAARAGSFAAR